MPDRQPREPVLSLSVRVTGGVFGDDRLTELDHGQIRVTERGIARTPRLLEQSERSKVDQLARAALTVEMPPSKGLKGVDGGNTAIDIAIDDERRSIVLAAGDEAPEPIWALIDAVESLEGMS